MTERQPNPLAEVLTDNPVTVMVTLVSILGLEVGAYYTWHESRLVSAALAATGVCAGLLLVRGRILP